MTFLLLGYLYGRGGIQNHTHWLARGLAERGHEVHVVTPPPFHGDAAVLPQADGYAVHPPYSLFSLTQLKPKSKREFDFGVVCGAGWRAMAGMLLNRKIRCRIFFEVMSGKRSGRFDPRMLVRTGFNHVIGQASPVLSQFCQQFGWRGPATTIPALPEPLELTASTIDLPDSRSGPHSKLRAAYFGRLAPHKGVSWLVERWPFLSDVVDTLDIFGTGSDEQSISDSIQRLGESSRIKLHGRYGSGQEYVRLLQSFDVVLLPTVGEEGAPLVLLEAMCCGVPFVANGVGGIPDYANPDCQITSGSRDDFENAIRTFHRDWVQGRISPQRLQDHYRRFFSYQALLTRWETFFDTLNSLPRSLT